jgi:hypothetical protein
MYVKIIAGVDSRERNNKCYILSSELYRQIRYLIIFTENEYKTNIKRAK